MNTEPKIVQISEEVILGLMERIAALETERYVLHEQEDHLIDLCAEHEKRIAAIEEKIK
jgi:hypothetical protein